jgi:hypothetical protein
MASSLALTINEDLFEDMDQSERKVKTPQQLREEAELLGEYLSDDMSMSGNSFRHVFHMFDEKLASRRNSGQT